MAKYKCDCTFEIIPGQKSRKPVLPVEIELRRARSDDISDENDEELEWSVDDVMDCAQQMISMKKRIYQKAKDNIDSKQAKDKEYYDRKHADPKVTNYYCPVFLVH